MNRDNLIKAIEKAEAEGDYEKASRLTMELLEN